MSFDVDNLIVIDIGINTHLLSNIGIKNSLGLGHASLGEGKQLILAVAAPRVLTFQQSSHGSVTSFALVDRHGSSRAICIAILAIWSNLHHFNQSSIEHVSNID